MVKLRSYSLLAGLSVIWGLAFVAIRYADFELSWVNLTLLRWLIVCACYLALYPLIAHPRAKFELKDAPRLVVVAVFSVAVYHLSLNYAEKTVDASLAGLLISLGPTFGVVLSAVILKERVGRRIAGAVAVALAGAVLVSLPDLNLGGSTALGPLAVVLAAFANGVYVTVSKPLVAKYGAIPVSMWAAFIGTATLLPLSSTSLVQQAESLSFDGWVSVLYLSILSTVVGYSIVYTLIDRHAVSRLSVQLYLIPVVSVLGGIAILGETVGYLTLAGGAMMLAAVWLATRDSV